MSEAEKSLGTSPRWAATFHKGIVSWTIQQLEQKYEKIPLNLCRLQAIKIDKIIHNQIW